MHRTLLLVFLATATLAAHAETPTCHAGDFNVDQLKAMSHVIAESTENIEVLMRGASTTVERLLLGTASNDTDRASSDAGMFAGFVIIYSRLVNDADRKATDEVIGHFSKVVTQDIRDYADSLTVVADKLPQYAGEIRAARDRVRKLQALFSCSEK